MENKILNELLASKVVAIARGVGSAQAADMAAALLAGGIRCIEVTFAQGGDLSDTLRSLEKIKAQLGDKVLLGAGTVMTPSQVRDAAAAGAAYIISPNVDKDVIGLTKELGLVSIPGAMTPTETVCAHQYGADIVKLFPAGVLGPAYIKALLGPLSYIPVMAVGGINPGNMNDFLKAGAAGVGVGGNLVDTKLIAAGRFDEITALAQQYKAL